MSGTLPKAICSVYLLCLWLCQSQQRPVRKKKRFWSKRWLLQRKQFSHMALINELREENTDDFKNYLRMSDENFRYLLNLVRSEIKKQDTQMREAISTEERLIATLRFLATGRSLEDLKFSAGISPQRLGVIIPETCKAIIKVLRKDFMKFPESEAEWSAIADGFETLWNFPNCGGCIDGIHVRIVAPANSGSFFYNYKGYHSIVLLGIVYTNYEFIMVDVGTNSRVSDGGVIECTDFYDELQGKKLRLPDNSSIREGLNFVFVANDAFALHDNLLKPFQRKGLTCRERKIFNYRVSRARRVVETVFGILASKFRIFHTAINLSLWKIDLVVMACCILHNFLRKMGRFNYIPVDMADKEDPTNHTLIPGEWREEQIAYAGLYSQNYTATHNAKENRLKYVQYFNSVGAVEWQDRMI